MNNIFSRLSSLRKITDKNQEEDFLTEIFAFILENDSELLKNFLKEFSIINDSKHFEVKSVKTQYSVKKILEYQQDTNSRIDLVVTLENHLIFIENKVDSTAGENQLKKYAEQLDSLKCTNKTLIFLTKNFEKISETYIKENCINPMHINIICIRWYQVYELLKQNISNSIFVKHFVNYLEDMNINLATQFSPSDLTTMNSMSKVLKMMEETVYGRVKDTFLDKIKLKYRQNQPEIQVRDQSRYTYIHYGAGLHITFGFYFNTYGSTYPTVGIEVWRDPKSENFQELSKIMAQILIDDNKWKSWGNIDNANIWAQIFINKNITDFLNNDNHLLEIESYLIECVERLSCVKNKIEKYL